MLLAFKYMFWYLISHYHYVRTKKCISKQILHSYDKDCKEFKKYANRVLYHMNKFGEIQPKLDDLKEKFCDKYPDVRVES